MVDIVDTPPDVVVILPPEAPPVVIIREEVVEVVHISEAPPGPPGAKGDPGNFDLGDLENAVEEYLADNPIDIDAPDLTTYFQNGLA